MSEMKEECSVNNTMQRHWVLKHLRDLHDLLPFVQFIYARNTHGGMLLLIKLQAEAGKEWKWQLQSVLLFKGTQWKSLL